MRDGKRKELFFAGDGPFNTALGQLCKATSHYDPDVWVWVPHDEQQFIKRFPNKQAAVDFIWPLLKPQT
jgi:hypothetical protein